MNQSDIINIYTSQFVWRLEDVHALRKLGCFVVPEGLNMTPVSIENTRFKWHANIYEEYESTENKAMTQLDLFVYRNKEEQINGCYDKFMLNCSVDFNTERGGGTIPEARYHKQLFGSHIQSFSFSFPRVYNFLEMKFTIILREIDLSGSNVKAMDSLDYKRNLLKDLEHVLAANKYF